MFIPFFGIERPMTADTEQNNNPKSNIRDELRTIAFRMREIQRLLGMRVAQENTRLEAEGLAPATEADFFKEGDQEPKISQKQVAHHVTVLGDLELGETIQLTTLNGQTISGRAGPIDYTPDDWLRIEIEPEDGAPIRYELATRAEDFGWNPITVRRYQQGDEDWVSMGILRTVAVV
jgi:hypothetical protein